MTDISTNLASEVEQPVEGAIAADAAVNAVKQPVGDATDAVVDLDLINTFTQPAISYSTQPVGSLTETEGGDDDDEDQYA
jgi:hypothetical protein